MLKIIDTHQHLWDTSNLSYPWLDAFDALGKRYLIEDYRRACEGINVVQSVHVEADVAPAHVVDEVRWLAQIVPTDGMIGAIVASAPLENSSAEEILKQLTEYELVVAIRRMAGTVPIISFIEVLNSSKGYNCLKNLTSPLISVLIISSFLQLSI